MVVVDSDSLREKPMEKRVNSKHRTMHNAEQRRSQDFHAYELLLLRRLQSDPVICIEWKEKLKKKRENEDFDLGEIPHSLWYLTVTLENKRERLLAFSESHLHESTQVHTFAESLLTRYMNSNLLTELHLDSIFKYGDDTTLPPEIFKCPSVRWLSMKYNYLDRIPPDIGRMCNLEFLALTNNKLQNKSLPYSLTFCSRLHTLMLDNNLLDALPGFLLAMPSLNTVYRHGNHNYFKSTFMWYHTDVTDRILRTASSGAGGTSAGRDFIAREPERLQFWAARAVIATKRNFFSDPAVPPPLRDYIADIYSLFNVCGHCHTAQLASRPGYKVITFKNPYLGNTCVPFQHWACSEACAQGIEIPARVEQITAATALDCSYDKYVAECQRMSFPVSASAYLGGAGGRARHHHRPHRRARDVVLPCLAASSPAAASRPTASSSDCSASCSVS